MNYDASGNRKLFLKQVSKFNGGKMESCSRIKNGNEVIPLEEDEARKIWRRAIRRTEAEVRVEKLKNGRAAGKDVATG